MAAFERPLPDFDEVVERLERALEATGHTRSTSIRRRSLAQALGPIEQVRDDLLNLLERSTDDGRADRVETIMRLLGSLAEFDNVDGAAVYEVEESETNNNNRGGAGSVRSGGGAAETETFECKICLDDVEVDQSYALLGCSHRYCQTCFVGHFQTKINDAEVDSVSLSCPFPGCPATPEAYLLEAVLPPAVYAKYLDFLVLKDVREDKAAVWCPNEECREAIIIANLREDRVDCPACKRSFCKQCQLIPWHEGETCDQAKLRSSPDAGLSEWMQNLGAKVKPCPNCKDAIEKNDGCNHMTCTRCKFQWCWLCVKPYVAGHYQTSDCSGLQFTRADTLEEARKLVPLPAQAAASSDRGPRAHLSVPISDAEVEAFQRIQSRTLRVENNIDEILLDLAAPPPPTSRQCIIA